MDDHPFYNIKGIVADIHPHKRIRSDAVILLQHIAMDELEDMIPDFAECEDIFCFEEKILDHWNEQLSELAILDAKRLMTYNDLLIVDHQALTRMLHSHGLSFSCDQVYFIAGLFEHLIAEIVNDAGAVSDKVFITIEHIKEAVNTNSEFYFPLYIEYEG